jgi:hypothetical protein
MSAGDPTCHTCGMPIEICECKPVARIFQYRDPRMYWGEMAQSHFLNSDHLISLDMVVHVLNAEIQWCYQNPMPDKVTDEFRDGFIKGIEQARKLIIEATKKVEA